MQSSLSLGFYEEYEQTKLDCLRSYNALLGKIADNEHEIETVHL